MSELSNKDLLLLLNKIIIRMKDSFLLLNFGRKVEGFQGVIKINRNIETDVLVFYFEIKEDSLKEPNWYDLFLKTIEKLVEEKHDSCLDLYKKTNHKVLLFVNYRNSKYSRLFVYYTNLSNLKMMINAYEYKIKVDNKLLSRRVNLLEYNIEVFNTHKEREIENDLLELLLII